ncbi:MAG: hypothetical protein EPO09_13570 [Aquabacterium sp.]|uniref:hypothetical protein n=1 Tax=Aquabacterium sp. TaxID=1872578 RepID=UPI001209802F|nr:hypothetical protein [Aquabacterium sp.]TAK93141.1 MAG: hypothetical protein EPO09_13570 [Aquabacterium sp.]
MCASDIQSNPFINIMKKIAILALALAASSAFATTSATGKISSISFSNQNQTYTVALSVTSGAPASCNTTATYVFQSTRGDASVNVTGGESPSFPQGLEMLLAAYNGAKTVTIKGLGICTTANGAEQLGVVTLQ